MTYSWDFFFFYIIPRSKLHLIAVIKIKYCLECFKTDTILRWTVLTLFFPHASFFWIFLFLCRYFTNLQKMMFDLFFFIFNSNSTKGKFRWNRSWNLWSMTLVVSVRTKQRQQCDHKHFNQALFSQNIFLDKGLMICGIICRLSAALTSLKRQVAAHFLDTCWIEINKSKKILILLNR